MQILEPTEANAVAVVKRQPYVEDEEDGGVTFEAPPHVPTPPSAVPEKRGSNTAGNRDSVFDYMVADDQPNTPQILFGKKSKDDKEMSMKNGAPSVFTDSRASSRNGYRNEEERKQSQEYDERGFSYGSGTINPRPYSEVNPSMASLDFMTPAARATRTKLNGEMKGHSRQNSGSEKKRKRDTDVLSDTPMTDVQLVRTEVNTPAVAHSGLTGGLGRMMTNDHEEILYARSPDRDRERGRDERDRSRRTEKREDPASPLKRSRHSRDDNGLGISIKGRAVKALSAVGGAFVASGGSEVSKTRRRASSSDHGQRGSHERDGERRESKKHKVHRHNGTSRDNIQPRSKRRGSNASPDSQRHKLKAIEYKKHDDSVSDSDYEDRNGNAKMVVFGAEAKLQKRCEVFLSNIPGDEVGKGYSVHKALKRWHKQCDTGRSGRGDEEGDLWRGLRLRRNDRGEVVIFF